MPFNLYLHHFSHSDICYFGTAAQKERELAHQAELKKEQEEVSRLKAELEKSQGRPAESEKSAATEKQLREEETRKLKESLEESKSEATSAEGELRDLKAKIAKWLVDISKINSEMDSKLLPLLPSFNLSLFFLYNLFWH